MADPRLEGRERFVARVSNVYLSILALFCFKLFIKISLNLLTYFYIIRGNREEAARISAQYYEKNCYSEY
jgi:ankyrin repeat/SOCS box protein 5